MNDYLESVSVDLLESELNARYEEQASELACLREQNEVLLMQIADFKKRSFEISTLESLCQNKDLELQTALRQMRETENSLLIDLTLKDEKIELQNKKIDALTCDLTKLQKSFDELARKSAKLSDEIWSKDIELQTARVDLETKNEESTRLLREQIEESARLLRDTKQTHLMETESLRETNDVLNKQLRLLNAERTQLQREFHELERTLDHARQIHDKHLSESSSAFDNLKSDYEGRLCKLNFTLSKTTKHLEDLQLACSESDTRFRAEEARAADLQRVLQAERAINEENEKRLLEIERSRADESARYATEIDSLSAKLDELKSEADEKSSQLEQASDVVSAFEKALEESRARENQLGGEFSSLRAERAAFEKRFKESLETEGELRGLLETQKAQFKTERRKLELEAERHLTNLQAELEHEFQTKLEMVLQETFQLRDQLDTRDNSNETERKNLQKWQVQLNFREQKVRESVEAVHREKTEIQRMVKQVASELQMARNTHPLKDFLSTVEMEIAQLQGQLKMATPESGEKARIKEALSKLFDQREVCSSVLQSSQRHLEEKAHQVLATLQISQG